MTFELKGVIGLGRWLVMARRVDSERNKLRRRDG